ncbi:MAG: ParB/RepB/Spo0J family partition protein [Spirochaetaceae bacterium]|jgi:ParB family chromosome partitioning protein|nr:ParB/RepB/Spo0J family partition protein [Spirochaetaceae bacterium]
MSKLSKYTQTAGSNAGAEAYAKWMDPKDIKINPDIAKLFENDRGVVEKIRDSMIAAGYDKSEPLVLWKESGCVVDGHTRLKAALEAGIDEVLVEEKEFADAGEAKVYTLTRQLNRRNLTAAALMEIASILDTMKNGGKNRSEVAKDLGVSRTTLYRAQEVNNKAPDPVKEQVRHGEISINQAYNKITEKEPKPSKPRQAEPERTTRADEEAAAEKGAAPVSPLLNREVVKPEMPVSIKAMLEEINRLLKEFLKANEGGIFDDMEKAENVRAACELAQKLI